MAIYACINGGVIVAQLVVVDPADGVGPLPPSGVDADFDQVAIIPDVITRSEGASETMLLFWNGGSPEFRESATLADLRGRKVAAINAERDRRIGAFDRFTYDGVVYDGNAKAQVNIDVAARGARAGLTLPDGFAWRAFDNSDVPMTNADILELERAMLEASNLHRYQMHGIARYLKDQAASSDATGLDAIGWPE